MKLQFYILLLYCFLISSFGISQNSVTLSGKIVNPIGEEVKNATVYLQTNPKKGVTTNENGMFSISIEYTTPTQLIINHVSYKQERILINKSLLKDNKNGQVDLKITLEYKTLPTVTITSKSIPDTVFGSKLTSVSDYEFVDDKILLLSYNKSLKKHGVLQLIASDNNLISTHKTPPNPKRLFKDYQGKLYLITEHKVYLINLHLNEVRLRPIESEGFYKLTTKIIDTCQSHFIYSNFSNAYPSFDYFAQKSTDTNAKKLHHVENSFMMDLYRAEYKYAPQKQKLWAFRQELKTGIDKEIWIGATNFTQSLYYVPLYAPLFVNNDTILVFDHYSDQLIKINSNFNKIDSIAISYHKDKDKKNWEQPILKDKDENKLYGLFLKHGYYYLKPINIHDGSTLISFKLNYRFAENVKVKNGYVYYLYRPYESSQKKFLYREVINTEID